MLSMLELSEYLLNQCGFKYVLTGKMNQDPSKDSLVNLDRLAVRMTIRICHPFCRCTGCSVYSLLMMMISGVYWRKGQRWPRCSHRLRLFDVLPRCFGHRPPNFYHHIRLVTRNTWILFFEVGALFHNFWRTFLPASSNGQISLGVHASSRGPAFATAAARRGAFPQFAVVLPRLGVRNFAKWKFKLKGNGSTPMI